MANEQEDDRKVCREDVRSLHSWSELTHETLLKSSMKEKPECENLSEQMEYQKISPNTVSERDHNGFSRTNEELETDESDDDSIFFISSSDMNMPSGSEDFDGFDSEGARNCASLPYFSSLPQDMENLYDNSPWSLPPDYKNIVKKKPVKICSECNKIITETCSCQKNEDTLTTRKSESHLKDLFKTKSLSKHVFKPKGINFQNRKHFLHSRTSPDFGHSSEEADQSDKVKNKIMSVWNNVKYGK